MRYLRKELIDLAEALLIMEKAEIQMKNQQFQVNSVQSSSLYELINLLFV